MISSYFTGVSNIFRLNVETGDLQGVSNAETGYFRPIPQADGSLIAFEYSGEGFTPVRFDVKSIEDLAAITFLGAEIVEKRPEIKEWAVGSPLSVELESIAPVERKYKPRKRIALGSIYPVVEGYKDGAAAGIHFNFEDPAYFNQIDITLSYSPGSRLSGGAR